MPDARVSFPLRWDEVPDVVMEDFTLATVPAIYARARRRGRRASTRRSGSLDALLELSARHEAEGQGDAPWPPNYAKQEGEPPRVQPSRMRRSPTSTRAAARTAGRRRRSPRRVPRPSRRATRTPACRPSGRARARRRPAAAARASRSSSSAGRPTKAEVYEGLERWKARHPEAAAHLEPADVLETAMRGRAYAWYRLRLNLIHVPEAIRPPQEPLDPDAAPDDWASLSDDERAAWMAGRTTSRRARAASATDPATEDAAARPTGGRGPAKDARRVTRTEFLALVARLGDAWTDGDAIAAAACFAADVDYADPTRYRFGSREALRPLLRAAARGPFDDMAPDPVRRGRADGVVEYTYRGHHAYHGAAIVEVDEDGLIAAWREWQHLDDESRLARVHGRSPRRGSRMSRRLTAAALAREAGVRARESSRRWSRSARSSRARTACSTPATRRSSRPWPRSSRPGSRPRTSGG